MKIGETANEMIPQGKNHGVSIAFSQDTGMSSFITDVMQHYSHADVTAFAFDYETVRLDKGEIKKKDVIYNYRYAGGDVSVYEVTGKQLKQYMNWARTISIPFKKGIKNIVIMPNVKNQNT